MKYGILLWPHANARYQEAERPLATSELRLLLGTDLTNEPVFETIAGAEFLTFECLLDRDEVASRISDSAHLLLLSEMRDDNSLIPLCSQREAIVGSDLSAILKYKGKTNEVFTRYLLNMAVYSGAFRNMAQGKLRVFDPMCGKGTTLFEALNRGYDATGSDIDKGDIREACSFFKKYLEYHKIKHRAQELSLTLPGKKQLPMRKFNFAMTPDAFKAGDGSTLSLILGDAQDAAYALPEKHFHAMAIDLPYNVQHAPGGAKPVALDKLLERILPQLYSRLMPGGAVALSFNTHAISKAKLAQALEGARFHVAEGPAYDGLAHWVEQAVTRDVIVGTR